MDFIKRINIKYFKFILLFIIATEFFSFFAFLYPFLNKFFFIIILASVLILSLRKLEYGVCAIIAELIIGSKGYLFSFDLGSFSLSIRIGLFAAVIAAWAGKILYEFIKTKKIRIDFFNSRLVRPFILLFAFIIYGAVSGVLRGNSFSNLFFDFNNWLFFCLIFPFFQVVKKENFKNLLAAVLAALTGLVLKTYFLLFVFSHHFISAMPSLYKWIRTTGVGEITDMGGGFYRIFFQSHIYALLGFFILLPLLNTKFVQHRERLFKKDSAILSLFISSLLSVVVISFSRSFWLAGAVILFCYCLILFFKKNIKQLFVNILLIFSVFIASFFLFAGIVKFPLPIESQPVSLSSMIEKRGLEISGDAAVGSRWNLLKPLWNRIKERPILGSGFGATVTYKTEDPRALENNPDGFYTTYAFEWGYFDFWLKMGIFGVLVYLYLIFKIFKLGWKNRNNDYTFGGLLALTALAIVHFFTPYLNHPLGIAYIILIAAIVDNFKNAKYT